MPDLEQIEQFNQELIKAGNEPAIAAQRGEEIERVLTPAEYPMDHNGGAGIKTNSQAAKPSAKPGAAPAGPATDDFLSQLDPGLFSGGENTPEAAVASDADAPSAGGFDDLFDNDILSNIAPAVPETPAASADDGLDSLFDDEPAGVPEPDHEDLSGLGDDFAALTSGLDTVSDEEPDDFPQTELPADSPADEEMPDLSLDDLDGADFDIGDLGDAGGEATALPADEDPGAMPAAAEDDFGLDDLGSLDFDADLPIDAPAADLTEDGPALADSVPELADDLGDLSGLGDFDDMGDLGAADAETPVDAGPDFGGDAGNLGDFPAMDTMPDFATDMSSEFGTDDFADEFNMGDFGKDFGVMEEVAETAPTPGEQKHSVMEEVDEVIAKANAADEADAFDLSPSDFKRIQENLGAMPRNLKIAVEEAVGDPKYNFDIIHPLINGMIKGESPKDIANLLARVTGKRIKIPTGYTRKTGLAFEAEQRSFAYQFRNNFLPMLRIIAVVTVIAGITLVAAYNWIYRPLYGNSLYDQGLDAIRHEEYVQGNQLFAQAYAVWPDNDHYLQYGIAFREMKQWGFARAKYEELLGMPDPRDKPAGKDRMHRKGILAFADFAAYTLRDYDSGVNYLNRLIAVNRLDHDPVIAEGDIFIEWARYTAPGDHLKPDDAVRRIIMAAWPDKGVLEDEVLTGPAGLYSAARFDYANLIKKEGQTDPLLSRMLRYFMRLGKFNEEQATLAAEAARKAQASGDYATQDQKEAALRGFNRRVTELEEETIKIKKLFLADPKAAPDPAVIAELGGYLIDKAEGQVKFMNEAFDLLMKAEKSGQNKEGEREAGIHYQLSRYFRALRNQANETETLKWSKFYLDERLKLRPLDRFELTQMIDTLIRQGEIAYGPTYGGQDWVNAQMKFEQARDLYEKSLQTRMIRDRSSLFGRVYAHLGDLKYYESSDYETALRQYRLARQNQYGVPPDDIKLLLPRMTIEELTKASQEMAYKAGFIWYNLAMSLQEGVVEKSSWLNEAAREFITAQGSVPMGNDNLDWAVANTSYLRANYETAAALYRGLAERVEMARRKLSPNIPEEDFQQRHMVEFLIRINNNLGISLYQLARQGGRVGNQYQAEAQYYTSRATELYQTISHRTLSDSFDDRTMDPMHFGQALLNLQAMISSNRAEVVYPFPDIYKDLQTTEIGLDLTSKGPAGMVTKPR